MVSWRRALDVGFLDDGKNAGEDQAFQPGGNEQLSGEVTMNDSSYNPSRPKCFPSQTSSFLPTPLLLSESRAKPPRPTLYPSRPFPP